MLWSGYTVSGEVWRYPGKGGWYFLTMPAELADKSRACCAGSQRAFGSFSVRATFGSTTWSTSLFADTRSSSYLPPVKADVRRRVRIEDGDRATADRLIPLILQAFKTAGGDFDAGRRLPHLLRDLGAEPTITACTLALPAGHPYLRLPLQFANPLEQRLLKLVSSDELATLRRAAEEELSDPHRWGTSFTLIQAHGQVPTEPRAEPAAPSP
jgi:hypothetical protein